MTGDGDVPCERFTVLEWRPAESASRCDVCDQAEGAHEQLGRRTASGAEIEELRRRMLMERHDKREAEQQRGVPSTDGDGRVPRVDGG